MPADFFFVAFEGWVEGCGVEAVGSGPEEEEVEAELSAGGDMLRAMGGVAGSVELREKWILLKERNPPATKTSSCLGRDWVRPSAAVNERMSPWIRMPGR